MSLHSRADGRPRRHDLVFVTPSSWQALLADRDDLQRHPLVAPWIDNGWPLIGRRAMPDDVDGVPLGLPLPPAFGKSRLSFVVQPRDVRSIAPPPALSSLRSIVPPTWLPTLDRLEDMALPHGADIRVCGSLAWHALTGLEYVTRSSDLDLLVYLSPGTKARELADDLAEIETTAPMKLDGELIGNAGAATNWREIHSRTPEILVKTVDGVEIVPSESFHSGSVSS